MDNKIDLNAADQACDETRKTWVKPSVEMLELFNVKSGTLAFSEPANPGTGSLS